MGSIFSGIVAVLKFIGSIIGIKDRAEARRAGQDEQKVATLETALETKGRMDDANASGPRTDSDVDRSLRNGTF